MGDPFRGWVVAGLAAAGTLLLLFLPLGEPPKGALWAALGLGGHALLLGILAWIGGLVLSVRQRGWPLWIGLTFFAAAVELLQPWMGRSREWSDWLFGVAGAGLICGTWRWPWRRRMRGGGMLILGLSPLLWVLGLLGAESRAFPVLMDSGSIWSRQGWTRNAVRLEAGGELGMRVEPVPSGEGEVQPSYPGLFRVTAHPDWRGMDVLQVSIYWPGESMAVMAVRIDDRADNPAYADRFQKEFTVTQGWNRVQIPVSEWSRASGGRRLRTERIRQWGVFLVSAPAFDYFALGTVKLEPGEERP